MTEREIGPYILEYAEMIPIPTMYFIKSEHQ